MAEFSDPIELATVSMSKAGRDLVVENLMRVGSILTDWAERQDDVVMGELDDVNQWLNDAIDALEAL